MLVQVPTVFLLGFLERERGGRGKEREGGKGRERGREGGRERGRERGREMCVCVCVQRSSKFACSEELGCGSRHNYFAPVWREILQWQPELPGHPIAKPERYMRGMTNVDVQRNKGFK